MPAARRFGVPLCAAVLALLPGVAVAQSPADKAADAQLAAARKASADGNPKAAADAYADFLKKYAGHRDANAARLGLGLALLDAPERDYGKAAEVLGAPANEEKFADRPLAHYYLAAARRGLGLKEADAAKAAARFAEAGRDFARARGLFDARKADGDAEWAARCRCDQAEMDLRLNKPKEARAAVEPFGKDAALAASKSRPLGLYLHGFASFLLGDAPAAGRSLGQCAPFDQPFGPHARFLLGRVHQLGGENAEAAAAFDAVLAGYEAQKKAAAEALKQPDRFKADPWEKARLEALARGPAPDYVAGATFHGACLNYEAGKFGEALGKFQAFAKDNPAAPLAPDAQLRVGFCLVQSKQYDEAVKLLRPLAEKHRRLADQVLYWTGKAQLAQALAAEPAARKPLLQAAAASLRSAADRAADLSGSDPDAKLRRADILFDMGDSLLAAGQYTDAAGAFETLWNDKTRPEKAEEVLLRVVAARQLNGEYYPADEKLAAFRKLFPQSPLTPHALFRGAENQYAHAAAMAKQKNPGAKEQFAKAAGRYEEVVAKFPEFERAGRAKYGLALCHAAAEEWEKAAAVLEALPAADRVGDAAAASFLLADCLIRTAPAKADDALQDNMLREKLGAAAGLLEGFVAANPKAPEAAEALLKLGYCHKRIGVQLAEPKERAEAFQKARAAFDRVQKEYGVTPVLGSAVLERAKVRALQGDKGGAVNDLRAFASDPLRQDPIAPLAAIALATFLREQNQPAPAAAVLKEARDRYEGPLAGDPARGEWTALLRYHHGVALFEAGRPTEARLLFEAVANGAGGKPIGVEAALKGCQAHAEDCRARIVLAEKERNQPGLRPDQIPAVDYRLREAKKDLVKVGEEMERRAEAFKKLQPAVDARGRLLYDAAWLYRNAAPFAPLNPNARPATEADKDTQSAALLAAAREAYTKFIAEFPDASLAVEARFELAELLADTGKPDDAVKLLKEALDKEPDDKPTDPKTADRVRLRLGAALFARKEYEAARGQFDTIAANPKSELLAQAVYRAGECLLALNKPDEAKEKLKVFRDDGKFQHVDRVSDRALLRLGHAYAAVKNWESSRQAFQLLLDRYAGSTWVPEARYGMGWAMQNQGKFDEAANQYAQVTAKSADELAGRAHLQIGLCRAAKGQNGEAVKVFKHVAGTYDAPDLRFTAMTEAARVLAADKQVEEAAKLLDKVIEDAPPGSEYAKVAKERRAGLKK